LVHRTPTASGNNSRESLKSFGTEKLIICAPVSVFVLSRLTVSLGIWVLSLQN
tara:strand:+ start:88754 stop:88912 length:159 start_codon:yes stop_codon:yes gene_type:complete